MNRRAPGTLVQMLVLLAVSSAGAVVAARYLHDRPLPIDYAWSDHVASTALQRGMTVVSVEEAKIIADAFSHLILDARRADDFTAGRIPGAMSLPVEDFDARFPEVAPLLSPDMPVVVYCSGEECDESLKLGEILITHGYTNVVLFAGGITAWTDAGLPLER